MQPARIGLLASIGVAEVGAPRQLGQIYDSNRYTLFAMLQRPGTEIVDLGVIRSRPDELEAGLRHAAESADLVLTSGGVSVGAADCLVEISSAWAGSISGRYTSNLGGPGCSAHWATRCTWG